MDKLPKIYHSNNNNFKNNNTNYCIFKNSKTLSNNQSIKTTINKLFRGLNSNYSIPVIINTKDQSFDTSLVSRTRDNVITKEKDIIPIKDIITIKEKN